jgi:hypothetical protein
VPGFSYEIIQICCDLIQFFVLEIRTEADCKLHSTLLRHPAFYGEVVVTKKKAVVAYPVFCFFQSKSAA